MLKEGTDELHGAHLHLYKTIIQSGAPPPSSWKTTVVAVIRRSGNVILPDSYRPIWMDKNNKDLFSGLLYDGPQPTLDQAAGQA
eukprot:1385698-Pyramimonas_sp.AAC.1